jgi:molybdenum cofactor cytidylyltransferase
MSSHMTNDQPIVAILLAAGAGTRFGGDKLLHPLDDGVAIAAHAARRLMAAHVEVFAVVRPGDFPLADMLEQEGCHVLMCPDASHGMGHSLAHGVASAREAGGWIVALADMPRIRAATITQLVQAISDGALIAAPRYRGERGHPVAFSRALRHELLALSGDTGARAVLQRHSDDIVLIDSDDAGVLLDVDRRADVARVV